MSERTSLLLSRRACLPLLAGAMSASLSTSTLAQGSKSGFDQWVAAFRARARARGISDATYSQVMTGVKPDTAVFDADPLAARVQGAALAVPQSPRLGLAHRHRQGEGEGVCPAARPSRERLRGRSLGAARAVGHRVGVWRSGRSEEPHATGHSGARGTRLGRAAPARLLGAGVAQCARDHRARLEHTGGDARILGRRHGAYPMDAGGMAQCGSRLRPRRPGVAVRQARRCTRRHRAVSRQARQVPTRRALGLRGSRRTRKDRRRCLTHLRSLAEGRRHPRRRQTLPAAGCVRQALGTGGGRSRLPARHRTSMPCALTIHR